MKVWTKWLEAQFPILARRSPRKRRSSLGASAENFEHRTLLSAHVGSAIAGHESPDAKKPPKKFGGTWTIAVSGNADTTATFVQHGKHVDVQLNLPDLGPFDTRGVIGKNHHVTASITKSTGGFTATQSIDVVMQDLTHIEGTYQSTVLNVLVASGSFTGTKV